MLNCRLKMVKPLKQKHRPQTVNFQNLNKNFDKFNNAATEQKPQTDAFNLIADILDEDKPFINIDTEDIQIEDDLFDNDNKKAIKNISKETNDVSKPNKTIFDDIDFKINEPIETITIPDNIETINVDDDIDIPSDDRIAIDAPKKVKIITDLNRLRIASNKIKKKYIRQNSKGILKKANKNSADWLKKAGYINTDGLETIDYNNDTDINDLKDTSKNNNDNINLKKASGAQVAAKKIVKKHKNPARKKTYQRPPQILQMILLIQIQLTIVTTQM